MKPSPDTFWKFTTVALMCVLILLACRSPGGSAAVAETVRARQFILVDSAGNALGEWGPDQENPSGISLRIYDPASKSGDPSIRMLAVDGGVDVYFQGDQGSGAVWLSTSKDSSSLSLLDTCRDPSHEGPLHIAEVMLAAEKATGSLHVVRRTALNIDGKHAEGQENLLSVPETEARSAPPGPK